MRMLPAFSGKTRWAVPAGALTAVAAVAVGSAITVAQAAPALPPRTPAQLLAELAGQTSLPPPLTGTVVETASFGLPQLPGMANASSFTSLLAGSHTVKIWYKDPAHVRLAVPVTMGETDFIRNGNTAWLWQSSTNTATQFGPALRHGAALPPGAVPKIPVPSPVSLTPQQAATRILAAVGPTTRVSTDSNVTIAGQAAYELVIAPRDSRSLIDRVTIAVDGQHPNVPLRVQVFARGATSPAFQVGYTSISFVTPAAANYRFTPPAGATVRKVPIPGQALLGLPPAGARMRCAAVAGPGWTGSAPAGSQQRREIMPSPGWTGSAPAGAQQRRVVMPGPGCVGLPPGVRAPARCVASPPPASTGSAPAGKRVQCVVMRGSGRAGPAPANVRTPLPVPGPGCAAFGPAGMRLGGAPMQGRPGQPGFGSAGAKVRRVPVQGPGRPGFTPAQLRCAAAMAPRVYGKGWLSVAIFPQAFPPGFVDMGNVAGAAGQVTRSLAGRGSGPGVGQVLGALLQSAHPVHGAWGSGRLIRTSLFSVLITNNGRVLVGAVTPQVLYAAAAQVK